MSSRHLFAGLALAGALWACGAVRAEAPRRADDREVTFELRVVTVSDAAMKRLPFVKGHAGHVLIDDDQVSELLGTVQQDRRSSVLQAPRLTVAPADKRTDTVEIKDEQTFVTGVEWVRTGATKTPRPKQETIATGLKWSVRPTFVKGGRAVRVRALLDYTFLDPPKADLFPICWAVTPAEVGKPGAEPLVFTQFIQQPRRSTLHFERTLTIPDGKTALLTGWAYDRQASEKLYLSVLGHVPGVGELLRVPRTVTRREHRFVLITARVIRPIDALTP